VLHLRVHHRGRIAIEGGGWAAVLAASETRTSDGKIWRRKLRVSLWSISSCLSTKLWLTHHGHFILSDGYRPTKVRCAWWKAISVDESAKS